MGKLYKTLHNIELARNNAIRNAKAANLPVNDDMSLLGLSELYKYQNNTETVKHDTEANKIHTTPVWEEPEGWPDIKTMLAEAEDVTYNGANYKPFFAITLDAKIIYKKRFVGASGNTLLLKTSDGQLIADSTSNDIQINWDTTKDIHCSDGYIVRYMIVYRKESELSGVIDLSNYNFQHMPILHIVYGAYTFKTAGKINNTSVAGSTSNNPHLLIFDTLPGCEFTTTTPCVSYCSNLRKLHYPVKLGTDMTPTSTNSSPSNTFLYHTPLLQELSIPGLTKAGTLGTTNDNYTQPFSNATFKCLYKLDLPDYEEGFIRVSYTKNGNVYAPKNPIINIPKIKKSNYYPVSTCGNVEEIVDNTIEYLHNSLFYKSTYGFEGLKKVTFSALKTIRLGSGVLIPDMPDLQELHLPSLEEILNAGTSTNSAIFGSSSKNQYISLGSINNLIIHNTLFSSQSNITLDIPIVEHIDANALTTGSHTFDKTIIAPLLKDVHLTYYDYTSSNSYVHTTLYLEHDGLINITLDTLANSVIGYSEPGGIVDNKIDTITIGSDTRFQMLSNLLKRATFKNLICNKLTDYSDTNNYSYKATQQNLTTSEIFTRTGITLDIATGSSLNGHLGTWMNDDDFAKFFTNLITLPEGETRTLTLGTNLTKLSEETKAIATSKGWVLE